MKLKVLRINGSKTLSIQVLLLILLVHWKAVGQHQIMTKSPETDRILSELAEVDFDDLTASKKSLFLVNCAWPFQYGKIGREEKLELVDRLVDSALFYARRAECTACAQWAILYRYNFFNELDSLQRDPSISPQTPSLELHYLASTFLKDFKVKNDINRNAVSRMGQLMDDPNIGLSQKVDAADNLATLYFYPKRMYDEALDLYAIAIDADEGSFEDFWKMQAIVPGVYKTPAALMARCYMNSGLILLKKGDFPKAVEYFREGGEKYAVLGDTLGMLWSQATLGEAYGIMNDASSAYNVLESSYRIVATASKGMVGSIPNRFYHIFEPLLPQAFDQRVGKRFLAALEKMIGKAKGARNMDAQAALYFSHLLVNEQLIAHYWNKEQRVAAPSYIDSLYSYVAGFDYGLETHLSDLQQVLDAKYYLWKYVDEGTTGYKKAFSSAVLAIGSQAARKAIYKIADPLLGSRGDHELLLQLNSEFIDFSLQEVSPEAMDMAFSRYLSWQELGRYDSALHYFRYFKSIEDSLANAENYMKLAQAGAAIKTAKAKQEAAALKLINHRQHQLILIVMWAVLLASGAFGFYVQKKRKDKQLALRDMELLNIKAQRAEEDRERLVKGYEGIRNELRESVKQAMKEQSRNLELMEIVKELRESKTESKCPKSAAKIERKLKSYNADAALTKLEQKAVEAYPRLYDYLRNHLSARNKAELIYCIMLLMDYDTQEISRTLHRSEKALRSLRYRVRKKLNLKEEDDLLAHLKAVAD